MNRFILTKIFLIGILLSVNINSYSNINCYSLKNSKPNELKQKANPLVHELAKGEIHNNKLDHRDNLFNLFQNPPSEAKPFVYWFWNGNQVNKEETIREIHLLKNAGFGGFRIWPIGDEDYGIPGYETLELISPKWNNMLRIASDEAEKLNMIVDLEMGTGWPYGGRFLKPDQYIQRIIVNQTELSGTGTFEKNVSDLLSITTASFKRSKEFLTQEIAFVRLCPQDLQDLNEIVSLDPFINNGNQIVRYNLKGGKYYLIWGVKQKGYQQVGKGVRGGDGPAMNYYDKEVTLAFLSRLKKIEEDTGIPLKGLIRSLSCGSLELNGANWSDGFSEKFRDMNGYQIEKWFPFIFHVTSGRVADARYFQPQNISPELKEKINRVRYDFNRFIVNQYLENFVKVIQSFCEDNGLLFRFQAYGFPWHVGISEGYLIPDIPEGNNWLFKNQPSTWPSSEAIKKPYDTESFNWSDKLGDMIWNKYAAAGAHLTGKNIVSCEAMTNITGLYDESLEDIKQADDMNFITGVTHSVVHAFNFSPPEAGIPGWVRFGTYFSEHNTWWKYINKWTIYNSRLSTVFQNTIPVADVGIIGPTGEVWGETGLNRIEMQTTPPYCYHLWESFSNIGSTCDYLSESVLDIAFSEKTSKSIHFPYKLLIFTDVNAITHRTIQVLKQYIAKGGKVAFVGSMPSRSLSLEAINSSNDNIKSEIEGLKRDHPGIVFKIESPASYDLLIPWSINLLKTVGIQPLIQINNPVNYVYQTQSVMGDRKFYFFVNSNRKQYVQLDVKFPTGKLTPWIWDPENGTREVLADAQRGSKSLNIHLEPLQSMLIVFDKTAHRRHIIVEGKSINYGDNLTINPSWNIDLYPLNRSKSSFKLDKLADFRDIPELENFAGEAIYTATINVNGNYSKLNLGNVNRGISEVLLNGEPLGIRWYGKHEYDISDALKQGSNRLEIKYTSIMKNCISTLTGSNSSNDNPIIKKVVEKSAVGIQGPIVLLK